MGLLLKTGALCYGKSEPEKAEKKGIRRGCCAEDAVRSVFAEYAGGIHRKSGGAQLQESGAGHLQEQIDQQKTQNEEMQRILSGDSDDVTEWVARDSYNYAAANERIFVDVTGN